MNKLIQEAIERLEKGWDYEAKDKERIKQFISTKLAEQRQEIIEIIEKEKETHDGFGKNYLNQIINLIKQK